MGMSGRETCQNDLLPVSVSSVTLLDCQPLFWFWRLFNSDRGPFGKRRVNFKEMSEALKLCKESQCAAPRSPERVVAHYLIKVKNNVFCKLSYVSYAGIPYYSNVVPSHLYRCPKGCESFSYLMTVLVGDSSGCLRQIQPLCNSCFLNNEHAFSWNRKSTI